MANKYTAQPIPPEQDLSDLYNKEGMTQAQIGIKYGTTQRVIHAWFKKLGIKSRIPKKTNQSGSNNDSWKGDNATYAAFHYRVESKRGKPHYCTVCGSLDAKRYEWANLTGKYEDINDYARMCVSCHRKYDKNRPNSSKHVRKTKK